MKILHWFIMVCALTLILPNAATAQGTDKTDKKDAKKPKKDDEKPKKNEPKSKKDDEKPKKGGDDKPKTAEKPSEKGKAKVVANVETDYSGLTREEKNTMTVCPQHGKRMSLSDNYRANASDYHESDGYPFARQLNYRRACDHCTKAMTREEKIAKKKTQLHKGEATFERCPLHNESLIISENYHALDYEKYPSADTPNAKAYKFKTYCPTCSKLHDKAAKAKEKEKAKEGK
jgi:hypothetical protein